MNKTVSITMSGALFVLEEEAYELLKEYLDSIRAHFSAYEDQEEIINDIEARVAEHFQERITKAKKSISKQDVKDLIRTMGTVEDFEEIEGEPKKKTSSAQSETKEEKTGRPWHGKKLYRDPENSIIGGVAAGLAMYFGIEPVIMRVLFFASIFAGGYGIVLYIILWVVMPEATTAAQRLEMQGQRLTIAKIEERVKQVMPKGKELPKGTISKILHFPGRVLRKIFLVIRSIVRKVFPMISGLIGIALLVASSILLFGLTFVLLVTVIDPSSTHIGFSPTEVFGPFLFFILLISAYVLLAVPVLFLGVVGQTFLRRKSAFTSSRTLTLLGGFICALLVFGVAFATNFSVIEDRVERYQERTIHTVTQEIPLERFTKLEAEGNMDIKVENGDAYFVTLTGPKELLDELELDQDEDWLKLDVEGTESFCIFFNCQRLRVQAVITTPSLTAIELNGHIDGQVLGFNEEAMTISVSGNSSLHSEVEVMDLTTTISGASSLHFQGRGTKLKSVITGFSQLEAMEFPVQSANLDLSGNSYAQVDAENSLNVRASGNSQVLYNDRLVNVESELSGNSRVESFIP